VSLAQQQKITQQTIVVKLGTSVLTSGTKKIDKAHLVEIVRQCALLKRQGHKVIVVTSGAIAAGRERLGSPSLPKNIATKQMLAAVGQSALIQIWEQLFALYNINIGQMLLTRADLEDRERYLNARDMLHTLLEHDIVPIVNENDAVATTEIKVGDNDNLSALVGILAHADKLVLLTDQKGLYTADPRQHPEAKLIQQVDTIDDKLRELAGDSGTSLGTGGMGTKLQAADIARRAGIHVVIAAGARPSIIQEIITGKGIGTHFPALSTPLESRKQWLLAAPHSVGAISIDMGATQAITERGSSLLPKGIKKVSGDFSRGSMIKICDLEGHILGRGLTHYSSRALRLIAGKHSHDINAILGYEYGHVAIHRDDLVLI